jgi:hypothetical protein
MVYKTVKWIGDTTLTNLNRCINTAVWVALLVPARAGAIAVPQCRCCFDCILPCSLNHPPLICPGCLSCGTLVSFTSQT